MTAAEVKGRKQAQPSSTRLIISWISLSLNPNGEDVPQLFSLCLPHCNVQSHRKLSKCFALLMLFLVVDLFKFISLNSAGDVNCDFVSELNSFFLFCFFSLNS